MQSLRELYQPVLSQQALDVLMNSWSKGTKDQYSPHIERWLRYCQTNLFDPFNATVYQGAEFLVSYFRNSGNKYISINTARSALSAIIMHENEFPLENILLLLG